MDNDQTKANKHVSLPADTSEEVVDAEIVTTPAETDAPVGDAAVLLEIESLIKSHITGIQKRRVELKKLREMLDDIFNNDEDYREKERAVKDATKAKKEVKARLSHLPNALESSEKVKNLAQEVKDMDNALSDYLREYQRLTGANEIEDDEGAIHEIIYIAKLVKRLMKK